VTLEYHFRPRRETSRSDPPDRLPAQIISHRKLHTRLDGSREAQDEVRHHSRGAEDSNTQQQDMKLVSRMGCWIGMWFAITISNIMNVKVGTGSFLCSIVTRSDLKVQHGTPTESNRNLRHLSSGSELTDVRYNNATFAVLGRQQRYT
jgi:hypothetical protein